MPVFTSIEVRTGTAAMARVLMCCLDVLALPVDTTTYCLEARAMRPRLELALSAAHPGCQQSFVHDFEYTNDTANGAACTCADVPSTEPAEAISGRTVIAEQIRTIVVHPVQLAIPVLAMNYVAHLRSHANWRRANSALFTHCLSE
jgi:hypothetical protein